MAQAHSVLFVPSENQDYSADQTDATKDWRKGNSFLAVCANLQRSRVDHLLPGRIAEAAVGESDYAYRDQNDPDDSSGFHGSDSARGCVCLRSD